MSKLPHSLYRAAQVRELDRAAIEEFHVPGYTLMSRAGSAAFNALARRWPAARRIVVVCGTGNNGGDGFIVARLAREANLEALVLQLGDGSRLKGDALTAAEAWRNAGGLTHGFAAHHLEGADVIVDAVFGTGLERAAEGEWRSAIDAINSHAAPVLAIDIPSGLHADSGTVLGAAVRADATVSFIGLKQGMFTGEGPEYCGQVEFDSLDVPSATYLYVSPAVSRISQEVIRRLLPARPRTCHKGRCGHVLVVGGERGMSGAVRMAGEAAARVGAGLVSVATRREHAASVGVPRPELMVHDVSDPRDLAPLLQRADVVAFGPGLGQSDWSRALLSMVLETDLPLVVDADGLNLLAREPGARGNWILTPHPGEAARLLGTSATEVQADRFAAVEAISDAYGGACVLKGAGTLVKHAEGITYLCDAGNPGMASGGMGDVLSGVIAGLVAQELDLEDAARAAVYVHARAADQAAADGERGLLAMDLMPFLRVLVNPGGEGN